MALLGLNGGQAAPSRRLQSASGADPWTLAEQQISAVTNPGYAPPDLPSAYNPQTYAPPPQAAAPQAAAPSPSVGSAGASTKPGDFSILDLFPGYQSSSALEQQGIGQADAQLKALRERAIINFGDPALASTAGFGLDPQAAANAQQNYQSGNSILARLDHAHQLAQTGIVNRLAAHGILGSGDLGYLSGQENQGYGNQVYDARQAILDLLAGGYNSYLGTRQSLAQSRINAMNAALQAYMTNPDAFAALLGGTLGGSAGGGGGGGSIPTDGTTPPNPGLPNSALDGPVNNTAPASQPAATVFRRALGGGGIRRIV